MTYTVIKLINNAFYTSGIVSREFETVSGSQINDGLDCLNEIISDKAIEKDLIPYFSKYTFNATPGVEKYFIPNLELLETMTFFINNVRYQTQGIKRKVYFGTSRANNINSLPFSWHVERCVGGASLYLYFLPQTNYPIEIWGLFRLNDVNINQDLLSHSTRVNLGLTQINGAGLLSAGNLIVNDIDLAGTYANINQLVTYINSGILPTITASNILNNLYLLETAGNNLRLQTNGSANITNSVSFYNFSTLNGPLDQSYFPLVLDRFYINYLKYALSERLCTEFNFTVPQSVSLQLAKYEAEIEKRSAPLDLSQGKTSTFNLNGGGGYSQINLGIGWTTN